jgi:hypothetical protein
LDRGLPALDPGLHRASAHGVALMDVVRLNAFLGGAWCGFMVALFLAWALYMHAGGPG